VFWREDNSNARESQAAATELENDEIKVMRKFRKRLIAIFIRDQWQVGGR